MNDQQRKRTVQSVCMEVFETFYDQFADGSLSNRQVAALLMEHRGYAERATQSRVSCAHPIIRAGRGPDALRLCARRNGRQLRLLKTTHRYDIRRLPI